MCNPPRFMHEFLVLQGVDQIDRGVEAHLSTLTCDPRDPNGCSQMGFAHSRLADKYDNLGLFGPGKLSKFEHQGLING